MYAKLLVAALLATTVSGAQAMIGDNGFNSLKRLQEQQSIVDIGRVTASGDGVVELYMRGSDGNRMLIGSHPIHAGANSNVRIKVDHPVRQDVVAVLKVDGRVAATRRFDVIEDR